MTAFLILMALLACALCFRFLHAHTEEGGRQPLDPEAEAEAAVELHRIRRNLDVSFTKTEQRRGAEQVQRRIAEALDERP
jgi:hypothetical protein